MALAVTLSFEEGSTILSLDGQNAFNSMLCHRVLPALATFSPAVGHVHRQPLRGSAAQTALRHGERYHGDSRLCATRETRVPLRWTRLQRRWSVPLRERFRATAPAAGTVLSDFIDYIAVSLPQEKCGDVDAIATVTTPEGGMLNRNISDTLLPGGVGADTRAATQQEIPDETGLAVAERGMWLMSAPVDTEQF